MELNFAGMVCRSTDAIASEIAKAVVDSFAEVVSVSKAVD